MSEAPEQNMPGSGTQIKTTGDVTITEDHHHLPESGKERTIIIVLFALLMLCLVTVVIDVARNTRRDEIQNQVIRTSAEKVVQAEEQLRQARVDLKTQVWLRSDSLTKENAELRGHVLAIEILLKSRGVLLPPVKPLVASPDPLPKEYQ